MTDSHNDKKDIVPVPGSVKLFSLTGDPDNPDLVKVPKKLLHVLWAAFAVLVLVIFVFCVYAVGQMAQKDGLISKLEARLDVAAQKLCNKDADEVAFIRKKGEDGAVKITISCNK